MAEIFDVYDEEGNWTGTEERAKVHVLGLWHHTVHCWLVRRGDGGQASILFQKRSSGKDTNPGCLDITVAGHLAAGETPHDVVRELEEELGIGAEFEELTSFGIVREHAEGTIGGKPYVDAEISHVFGLVTETNLADFRLQVEEVTGLYEANAAELISLMNGTLSRLIVEGVELRDGKLVESVIKVGRELFVPRDFGYYVEVFEFLRGLTAGR
ncbi:NUDIX domain-containing protein [Cohnella suwonensis]|uniref:NUDIX domain-containing protein n=1 Tax=Cohnella suwonensis TaxID=696072 RepID=A0ABW0LWP9_9BACL